ncbi:MAG: tRNA (guanosine(46)-N7)-methyltransferase TrmB [Bifidobacterium sp.]|nr:tRNA (guanosine(46)-N7)-methyltransferase TrmB [Bifidobacterium sp.]MCH4209603.1 tRNA (guanosine(46)-N7)-methyltransferase TrmB [Bifidobacterium sp.]MCI1225170.1 tRNA (guanosine(46)-N7)-methyltransferase TrmB [Bifidobacterium sp.]
MSESGTSDESGTAGAPGAANGVAVVPRAVNVANDEESMIDAGIVDGAVGVAGAGGVEGGEGRSGPDRRSIESAADNPGATAARLAGRPVLSFVRRSGRLDDRLRRAWDVYHDRYLLDISQASGSLSVRAGLNVDEDFVREHWGNADSLIVEIGTGQGENVVAAAQANPETNFLAIEVYDPGVAHTMLLAGKRGLSNLRIAQVNAPEFFEAAEDGLISEVWTFFPDPWPKMRHHKRRIVQDELAAQIHRTLAAGGVWRIATDIEDYALHVHEIMDGRSDFENLGGLTLSLPLEHVGKGNADEAARLPHGDFSESLRFDGRVLTNFEKKGIKAGRVIHDFAYRAM